MVVCSIHTILEKKPIKFTNLSIEMTEVETVFRSLHGNSTGLQSHHLKGSSNNYYTNSRCLIVVNTDWDPDEASFLAVRVFLLLSIDLDYHVVNHFTTRLLDSP